MTTCDILLAHLCPLNNSSSLSPHIPLFLPFFLPSFFLSLSLSESVFLSLSLCFTPRSFSLYPPLGAASAPSSAPPDKEIARGEGTASEGSQRQLSKSCETGLDVYLLAQSAFISARVTRAVCYLPHRDTYGREYEKSVRELDPLVSCFAPANSPRSTGVTEERASE